MVLRIHSSSFVKRILNKNGKFKYNFFLRFYMNDWAFKNDSENSLRTLQSLNRRKHILHVFKTKYALILNY